MHPENAIQKYKRSMVYMPSAKYGGVEIFSINLIHGLLDFGVDAWIYCAENGPVSKELNPEANKRFITGNFDDLITAISQKKIERIYLPSQGIEQGTVLLKHIFPKLEVIVTCHATIPAGWSYQSADAFVSCSHWLAKITSDFLNYHTTAIYNGIDPAVFYFEGQQPAAKPILLWAGRAGDPIKNVALFIDTIAQLNSDELDIWVASPQDQSFLSTKQRSILEKFNYQWTQSNYQGMAALYNQTANSGGFLLMTSIREGLGLVAIEAQFCGCPVIAPNHSGVSEAAMQPQLRFQPSSDSATAAADLVKAALQNRLQYHRGHRLNEAAQGVFSQAVMTQQYMQVGSSRDTPKSSIHLVSYIKRIKYSGLHQRLRLATTLLQQGVATNYPLQLLSYLIKG